MADDSQRAGNDDSNPFSKQNETGVRKKIRKIQRASSDELNPPGEKNETEVKKNRKRTQSDRNDETDDKNEKEEDDGFEKQSGTGQNQDQLEPLDLSRNNCHRELAPRDMLPITYFRAENDLCSTPIYSLSTCTPPVQCVDSESSELPAPLDLRSRRVFAPPSICLSPQIPPPQLPQIRLNDVFLGEIIDDMAAEVPVEVLPVVLADEAAGVFNGVSQSPEYSISPNEETQNFDSILNLNSSSEPNIQNQSEDINEEQQQPENPDFNFKSNHENQSEDIDEEQFQQLPENAFDPVVAVINRANQVKTNPSSVDRPKA